MISWRSSGQSREELLTHRLCNPNFGYHNSFVR
jgi:hypothetical protein